MRNAIAAASALLLASACVPAQSPAAVAPVPARMSAAPPQVAPQPAPQFTFSGKLTQGGWIRGSVPRGTISAKLDETNLVVAPDGAFFAGFNRDSGPNATLTATLADGRTITHQLAISPRDWDLEHINADFHAGVPSSEFLARRKPELARIHAARAMETDADGWQQSFIWPVEGRISGRFGSQRIYRGGKAGTYHSGLDIATGESGTPFVAPADGVVVLAADKPFSLEGHLIIIDHGHGLNSAFLHASEIDVREGDRVRRGEVIGRIGATGRATGPHLHWSLMWRDARLDPLLILPKD